MTGEDFLSSSDNEHIREKLLFTANIFNEAKKAFVNSLERKLRETEQSPDSDTISILLNTTLYLHKEDMESFNNELTAIIEKYTDLSSSKQPYSMLLSVSEPENL